MNFDARISAAIAFREKRQGAEKRGECIGYSDNRDKVGPCRRYEMWVTPEMCRKCATDPDFKQSLYARWVRVKEGRLQSCTHRGETTGEKKYGCCGGKKQFITPIFYCELRRYNLDETICWTCGHYKEDKPT